MQITPISLKEASAFVDKYHRHHTAPQGHKFSIGLCDNGKIIGVAICGRPVGRKLDDGLTIEITRVCTDGTKNACSMLYGACCRAAKALGYSKVITYTLESENGSSLKASNFICDGRAGGKHWTGERNRELQISLLEHRTPKEMKIRWSRTL